MPNPGDETTSTNEMCHQTDFGRFMKKVPNQWLAKNLLLAVLSDFVFV